VGPVGTIVDELNVFNLPLVFRDEAHMRKVIDGPIGTELIDKITAAPTSRLVGLGGMDGGTRNVYGKKAFKTPADLKGQKIRVMGNPIFVETMNAMGGNGISMGFNELYTALQTGVVDVAMVLTAGFMLVWGVQLVRTTSSSWAASCRASSPRRSPRPWRACTPSSSRSSSTGTTSCATCRACRTAWSRRSRW
jgi:hypothetical protein